MCSATVDRAIFVRRVHSGEVRVWLDGKVKRVSPCRVRAWIGQGGGSGGDGPEAPVVQETKESEADADAELRALPISDADELGVPVAEPMSTGAATSTVGWQWAPSTSRVCVL